MKDVVIPNGDKMTDEEFWAALMEAVDEPLTPEEEWNMHYEEQNAERFCRRNKPGYKKVYNTVFNPELDLFVVEEDDANYKPWESDEDSCPYVFS